MKRGRKKTIFLPKDSCGGWLVTEADSVLIWDANIFWVKVCCSPHQQPPSLTEVLGWLPFTRDNYPKCAPRKPIFHSNQTPRENNIKTTVEYFLRIICSTDGLFLQFKESSSVLMLLRKSLQRCSQEQRWFEPLSNCHPHGGARGKTYQHQYNCIQDSVIAGFFKRW